MPRPPVPRQSAHIVSALWPALAIAALSGRACIAQTLQSAQGAATTHKPAASKSPNVKSGVIATFDASGETLTLRTAAATPEVYVVTAKTHYNRSRRVASRTDFKPGDSVVLHFRRSRSDGALLVTELDDAASWNWISTVRKTTTAATVKEIAENTLSVTVGADNVPLEYTISDKTRWEKAGKEVDAAAFKPGDHVFVVPRSLPSGAIMARAVADSTAGAAEEKERLATSVHGVISSVDMAAHKVVLKTAAGDTRNLAFNEETELIVAGKSQPQSGLKAGLRVAARIRHEAGDEVTWRFTVETQRKPTVTRKKTPVPKGAAAPH